MDYGVLARSYNTLQYSQDLKRILTSFCRIDEFNNLSKFELHQKINSLIFKHYDGEEVLKYKLAYTFSKQNYVAAFEVKAKDSRADFLVINGHTKCFEIKSKIDTLTRLKKQSKDYGDVFEFNTVVIDKKHLNNVANLLPLHYGIWYYQGNKKIVFREAELSPFLNSECQLSLLTKKELLSFFKTKDVSAILSEFDSEKINYILKQALKFRYSKRWAFVKENWNNILPIDLQFFFSTNICPKLIYND